jgi:hypothetical protein
MRDLLLALNDLRADAAREILPLLEMPLTQHGELMLEVLTWSRDPRVGAWLRVWASRRVAMTRRASWRRQQLPPRRPSVPADFPYRAVLRTLLGHGSPETELFLTLAASDWDPTYRSAAVASLGWWEPFRRAEVLNSLAQERRDPSPEVRQFARAALARWGERAALQWFRTALTGEDGRRIHEAIQLAAQESLTLLWPDLDRLADADDLDVAHHARDALERLCEEMSQRPGQ